MKKALLFLLTLLVAAGGAYAQQYTKTAPASTTINEGKPFNTTAANKVQWLYKQPGGGTYFQTAPSGMITKIYVNAYGTTNTTTLTNFKIKMKHTTQTNTTATFAPVDLVFSAASYTIPAFTTQWIGFDLQTPFAYDNTKYVIIEFSHEGMTGGFNIRSESNPTNWGTHAPSVSATTGTAYSVNADMGFDVRIPCDTITGINVSNITYNSMDITWPGLSRDSVFEYIVTDTANPPAADPGGNFQPYITNNKIELKNMPSDSCFYLHIARICKMANTFDTFSSKWTTVKLCTLPACETPQVTISDVDATTGIATWTPVPTVKGYEYAVSILPTPPVKGTYTIATSAILQGLSPNRTWFFHLRAICEPTPLSSWSSTPLHTMTTSVEDVNGGDFNVRAYPNPVKNELNVMMIGNMGDNATIVISDVTGKVVRNISVAGNETKVDMGNLAGGLYILKYSDATRSQILKINKQ